MLSGHTTVRYLLHIEIHGEHIIKKARLSSAKKYRLETKPSVHDDMPLSHIQLLRYTFTIAEQIYDIS